VAKYDQFIKRPLEEYDYTLEEIKELKKCSENIWTFLKYVKIVHPDRGRIIYKPYNYQKKLIETVLKNRFNVFLLSRQSGKSTTIAAYALWYAIFNSDKTIGIVSNKQISAIDILHRIAIMYEELPVWLKPGVESFGKMGIDFDNGTRILVSATSADAFRGRTINILIADEFAFVRKHVADEFWSANYPTISASEEAKIIIISTPCGVFNQFHTIYTMAERKENEFVSLKFDWRVVPGRDDAWAENQKKNLGARRFKQEYAVEFLGSIATVIDASVLEDLYTLTQDPIEEQLDGAFQIYEKPDGHSQYILGVDTAKGTGENYSVIQVLKLVSMKPIKMIQVAKYHSNTVDVFKFADTVNKVSYYYNNAYIMCENNSEGAAVVNRLWWEHENEGLVSMGSKAQDLGIRATTKTKPRAVLLMKKLIEDGSLEIVDYDTVAELSSFIEQNNKFFGKDTNDDTISALYWACYILEMNLFEESYELKKGSKEEEDEGWGVLSDVEPGEDFSWLTRDF